jgi:hypothetical protein
MGGCAGSIKVAAEPMAVSNYADGVTNISSCCRVIAATADENGQLCGRQKAVARQ